jgi:hypothetical protein
VTAAMVLARIEAAGGIAALRPDGRVAIGNASRLPPGLLEEARRHREAVAALVAARAVERAAPDPDPWAALHRILAAGPAEAVCSTSWLRSIAGSIARALADGARRERDAEGYLALVRPDGRRLIVAPGTVAELAEAGLLPPLPQEQGEMQRPPSWSDPEDVPSSGAWCGCCGRFDRSGGRWWREAEAPSGWCCWTCHPPEGRSEAAVVAVRT